MKTTPNSQNFPQFMQGETVNKVKAVSKTEIADFRFNPAIQNRPEEILNIEKEKKRNCTHSCHNGSPCHAFIHSRNFTSSV